MRVLSVDPGATRCGWAILETGPVYIASGVEYFPRGGGETFQDYRLELVARWVVAAPEILFSHSPLPDEVVLETVPSRGFNIPEQGYLANVQATTFQAVAMANHFKVRQISARTVQAGIAIRGKGKKITKPQVRNGVISLIPELKDRLSDWTKVFEEPDALAIGLAHLGYSNK